MSTEPKHPGEIVRLTCVVPSGMTVTAIADALGVSRKSFSEFLNTHAGLSPEMALRLSSAFGGTAEYWMKFQTDWDLWHAKRKMVEKLKVVKKLSNAVDSEQGALFDKVA